jgi:hypothetical protein
MTQHDPQRTIEAAMERLRSEIALAGDRLGEARSAMERRSVEMLLAETALADHGYRLARDDHHRRRRQLEELQAALGALILEHTSRSLETTPAAG